jgi:hypothetical protein
MTDFKRLTAVENGDRKPCGAGISQNVPLAWECINPASIRGPRRGPAHQAHGNEAAPEGAPTPTEALPSASRHQRKGRVTHVFYRIKRENRGGGYYSVPPNFRWCLVRRSRPGSEPWLDWLPTPDGASVFDLEEALATVEWYELQDAWIVADVV